MKQTGSAKFLLCRINKSGKEFVAGYDDAREAGAARRALEAEYPDREYQVINRQLDLEPYIRGSE